MADSDSDSEFDSDSDIKKETSPLYYHIGGEAKKKISLPLSLNKNCYVGNNDFLGGRKPSGILGGMGKRKTTRYQKASLWQNDILLRHSCHNFAAKKQPPF